MSSLPGWLWRDWSLLAKAGLAVTAVISLTLMAAGYYVGGRWLHDKEANSRELLHIVAAVVGANSSAALEFDDSTAAAETLTSLAGYPDVIQAVLYGPGGEPFATYRRADLADPLPSPVWRSGGFEAGERTLTLYEPVALGREQFGVLALTVDTSSLQLWVEATGSLLRLTTLAAVLAALTIIYLLLRPQVILPLQKILSATRSIAINRDYSTRLQKRRDDELGEVIDSINQLLATIEAHADDLGDALVEAERAGQAKSIFLANMSHELRTPLNGVLGMTELLQRTELTEQQQKYAGQVLRSGKDLLAILNDILDFSKIEAHRLELESIPFDICDAVEMVTGLFQPSAQGKDVQLITDIDAEVPRWLIGDPLRFRQIVVNLVSNAVKFSQHGQVRVVMKNAPTGIAGDIQLQVIDSGIGIETSAISRIFNAFSQADGSTTRRYGGTGLGLAIAEQLARLMNGHIQAESELGKGATFTLQVSLEVPPDRVPEANDQAEVDLPNGRGSTNEDASLAGGRVRKANLLLAEDNLMNQELAQAMLQGMGHQVTAVDNGQMALDLLSKSRFDLVLMDGEMPHMDGYEATRQLRLLEKKEGRSPQVIVALTANALSEARHQCLAAGMDDYLSKPYSFEDLQRLIDRWVAAPSE